MRPVYKTTAIERQNIEKEHKEKVLISKMKSSIKIVVTNV
jgi:hypothetical protein